MIKNRPIGGSKLTEFDGLRVADAVVLTGVCMPRETGSIEHVLEIKTYEKAEERKEKVFRVVVNGERWYPIFRNELKLAEAGNGALPV